MNTFHDDFHRCVHHPHQPILGVCASCLSDRLVALAKPHHRDRPSDSGSVISPHDHVEVPLSDQRRSPRPGFVVGSTSSNQVAHDQQEDIRNLILQKLKSDASAPSSPDRNHKSVSATSPCSHQREKPLPVGSNAPFSCGRLSMKTEVEAPRKKKTSRWSLFQHNEDVREQRLIAKPGQSSSTAQVMADGEGGTASSSGSLQERRRQEQVSSAMQSPGLSARRQSRESIGSNATVDLEPLADNRLNESAVNLEVERIDSTSWLSSFFRRRKLRSKSVSVSKSSITEIEFNELIESSTSSVVDAGRLSLDGERPNIRQILKKHEAALITKQAHHSPTAEIDHAKHSCSDTHSEGANLTDLHKRKLVLSSSSARSSIGISEKHKDFHAVHAPSGLVMGENFWRSDSSRVEERFRDRHSTRNCNDHKNSTMEDLEDDRYFPRSRSWGRAWSKTLSPLWVFKQHNRKDDGIIAAQNSCSTSRHSQQTSAVSKESSPGYKFYFSPFRRNRHSRTGGSMRFLH